MAELQRFEGGSLARGEFEPIEILPDRDSLLQLDVRGDDLELRVWPEGDEMPEGAGVTMTDTTFRQGWIGLAYMADEADAHGIYRYVWISDEGPIRGDPPLDPPVRFLRGDTNDDGAVDLSDAQLVLSWLFVGAAAPGCAAAADSNGDGRADISDAVYLLRHLFLSGPAPGAAFPDCGPMPYGEKLGV